MSAGTIKEFLIGLGVEIHTSDVQRFFVTISDMTKATLKLGLTLEGMATALKGALIATASALEKLFYIAQRGGTTVDSLKALQYGMSQIGLSAADASQALEGLAFAMRLNPGAESLLNHLGVSTRTAAHAMRDTNEVTKEFIGKLSKMPFYIAAQYAEVFGINSRSLFMMLQNFKGLQAKEAEWRSMAKQTGVDLQDSATKSRDFMNSVRGVGEVIELLWIKVSTVLIGRLRPQIDGFRKFLLDHAKEIEAFGVSLGTSLVETADGLARMLPQIAKLIEATLGWKHTFELIGDVIMYRVFGPLGLAFALLTQLWEKIQSDNQKFDKANPPGSKRGLQTDERGNRYLPGWSWEDIFKGGKPRWHGGEAAPQVEKQSYHPAAYQPLANGDNPFKSVEAAWRVPPGLLDRVWDAESGRGRSMRSSAGAEGHFQFMPGTAKQYGLRDPYDLAQSANAAGHMLSDLLRKYGGNLAKALAGYNWGSGNLDRDIAQHGEAWQSFLPRETKGYLGRVLGGAPLGGNASGGGSAPVTIQQRTEIHVHGAEPHAAAREVERRQDGVNSAMVRYFRGAVIA